MARVVYYLNEDLRQGVLRTLPVDSADTRQECRILADSHTGATGCRTLDSLHVTCAGLFMAQEFVTSDRRQTALAQLAGLRVSNPLAKRPSETDQPQSPP